MKTKEEILAKRIVKFPEDPVGVYPPAYTMTDESIKRNVYAAMEEYAAQFKDSPYQAGSAELTDQDYDQLISQNVEKMWGSLEMASLDYFKETGKITGSFRFRLLSLMQFHQWRVEKAAHVACAEKYTAIIEQKDKEIERLQNALAKALEWLNDIWRIVNKSRR